MTDHRPHPVEANQVIKLIESAALLAESYEMGVSATMLWSVLALARVDAKLTPE